MKKTANDVMTAMQSMIQSCSRMHNAATVSKYARKLVPSATRAKMYNKIVVSAIEKYNKWLGKEVKRIKAKLK